MIAKLHGTDLVIYSNFRKGITESYSRINMVFLLLLFYSWSKFFLLRVDPISKRSKQEFMQFDTSLFWKRGRGCH